MVSCVGIGTVTGAIFLIVLLFVAGDIDAVVNSSAGPLLQILIHATQNRIGGVCLLMYVAQMARQVWIKANRTGSLSSVWRLPE